MSYSQFKKLTEVSKKFNLKVETVVLFPTVQPIAASEYLNLSLQVAEKLGLVTELK
jgi:hypothetical protein